MNALKVMPTKTQRNAARFHSVSSTKSMLRTCNHFVSGIPHGNRSAVRELKSRGWHSKQKSLLPQKETRVEFLRAQQEKRFAHLVEDPHPVENLAEVWTSAAQVA